MFQLLLSVVVVTRNESDSLKETLTRLAQSVAGIVTDYELIIVDNASEDASVSTLKQLTRPGGLPNLQVFALTKGVDTDTASWVGLENALGDYVAVIDPAVDDPAMIANMLEQSLQGNDVVFAKNEIAAPVGLAYRTSFALFGMAYKWFNGVNIAKEAPQYRMLSRRVINFILQHPTPSMSYRHLPATAGFAKVTIGYRATPSRAKPKSLWYAIDRGTRLLVSSTRGPMRMVSTLSLFGAVANLVYSGYVIAVALLKTSVAEGWVTLSLQQSGMFFLISLVLFVLGEYIMQMASVSNEGPPYHVGQEFTSAVMKRKEKLNVEDTPPALPVASADARRVAEGPLMLDALVVGGGFYGASVAAYLRRTRGFRSVRLVEQAGELLQRASYSNQARVHNGYHYPRSFVTAYRSRVNLPRFVRDFPSAVKTDFTKLYAIARNNSKVTARQFERFCAEIGASLEHAPSSLRDLFEPRLIEAVFVVQEYAFDTTRLAAWAHQELAELKVDLRLSTRVKSVSRSGPEAMRVECESAGGLETVETRYLFNCTYSGLNHLGGEYGVARTKLKHEITEMALVDLPPPLAKIGVTVMDGAFFSFMPFPARQLHTLSHVRYTPHFSWEDQPDTDPYAMLSAYHRDTRFDRMRRDAARYMPAIADARYVDSLFEVKTVLVKNEGDDGRPILFERHPNLPGCYSILGGKIDNIYDVLEKLDQEPLPLGQVATTPAEAHQS